MFKYIAIALLLIVTACGDETTTFSEGVKPNIVTQTVTVYPKLSDISAPQSPVINEIKFDYPRTVCQTTNCPVDNTSNIYIGLSKIDWEKFVANQASIKAYIDQFKDRLTEINIMLKDWREK